jgi:hypothetical protein
MSEFKPMVKMETTEPSVILKLKKGGHVNMKHGGNAESGYKRMSDGGMMDSLDRASMGARPAMSVSPMARAMAARKKKPMIAPPRMKEGGETSAMHKSEMTKMSKMEKELKSHEGKPASKGHKGLKTGGIAKSTKPGGYKKGGMMHGGMHGDMMGGYKKGGAAKKFADGGRVQDDGRPVKMPMKAPSDPVVISRLSGTFKKGGSVKRKAEGGPPGTQPNKEEKGEAAWRAGEKSENEAMRNAMNPANWFKPLIEKFKGAPGAVTETTKSKTVVPAKKYGGKAC